MSHYLCCRLRGAVYHHLLEFSQPTPYWSSFKLSFSSFHSTPITLEDSRPIRLRELFDTLLSASPVHLGALSLRRAKSESGGQIKGIL